MKLSNKRYEDESYEDYRARLKEEKLATKNRRRYRYINNGIPYVNPVRQLKKKLKKAEEAVGHV